MKATRVIKSFEAISQDQIAEPTDSAVSSAPAPKRVKASAPPSEPREHRPADDRELAPVQPYPRWGINE